MENLSDNWLTDGLIDFEYKKYILLAYLQRAKTAFVQQELYPTFSNLIFHYQNLLKVRDGQQLLHKNFPKQISKADFQKLKLSYQHIIEDDEVMKELTDIIFFSVPKFEKLLANGKELYEVISGQILIEPIGISPISPEEGYVFLNPYMQKNAFLYQYKVSIFENVEAKYRGIQMKFLEKIRVGIGQTYENIKMEVTRKYKLLPNPATFLLRANVPCPYEETLLPISKRLLMQHIATQY